MAYPSRPVRVSIAAGSAVIGLALVWAAQAGLSTPDSALVGAPNWPGTSSTSPNAAEPITPERPPADADQIDVALEADNEMWNQPLITRTKGLDSTPAFGSSTRSR
jgi:hypothetical protein